MTLTEMRIAVVAVYKNRMNLAATLKDTKTVVSKLERMIGAVLHLLFIFFYLTIWNVSPSCLHCQLLMMMSSCTQASLPQVVLLCGLAQSGESYLLTCHAAHAESPGAWAFGSAHQLIPPLLCGVQVNFQHVWVTFGSILLSFTFVFGNSIKTLFESVIFLFVVHPFDVGDLISIGTTPGDLCTVGACLALRMHACMHAESMWDLHAPHLLAHACEIDFGTQVLLLSPELTALAIHGQYRSVMWPTRSSAFA